MKRECRIRKKLKRLEKTYYYKVLRALVCVCACAIYILGLSGCNPDEPQVLEEVKMPISICLPVSEVYNPQGAPSLRAFGDPGTTEQFALPQYIYYFIVNQTVDGDDSSWKVYDVQTKSVEECGAKAWKAKWDTVLYAGPYDTIGDMVYQFNEELTMMLPSTRSNGRVYAVASAVPLTFNSSIAAATALTTLLNLTFSFKDEGTEEQKAAAALVKANLQNIFSTPHNYNYKGAYYGSFSKSVKVPHLNLLLYHVAAKVDLMWNVKDSLREDVKLSYIAAENLYDGPCYVFKPTENMIAGAAYESGYTMPILSVLSPGTQWNGRAYFYAIPYRKNNNTSGDYPLQLRLLKNGDDPSAAASYYKAIVDTKVPTVWTSWIRGQITIKNKEYNYPTP